MIVVSSQHQNNYAHNQPQQMYQSLLNFPHQDHQDHQNVLQMPMHNYIQQSYPNYPQQSNQMYPQQSNQMYSQQHQMNYNQQPHMSYQNQQQLSYQQQPLKNYIHKPQQQMIQKPYVHEAEQLPQPAALSSEPIYHHQQQQQQEQQRQEEQQKQEETQYPQQIKQEQYQIVEKAPEIEIVKKAPEVEIVKNTENSKTSVEYDYNYAVHDENTNDIKQHHEKAHNGAIVGQYSLMDADGYLRIVDYTADDVNGFKAVVRREFVEAPKNAPIIEKAPVAQKQNTPQYFSSPAPSKSPITAVSKPTPVPQQSYKQLISAPIVQQQQYQFSAPASTKHIIPTLHDLQFFSPSPPSVPVAEKYNAPNSMIHERQEHQQQAQQQQALQQHQFFFHPAPVLEKYLTPANHQHQYFSAPTAAPTKVNAPVTEYASFENNHPYTEVNFAGPVSNYHY